MEQELLTAALTGLAASVVIIKLMSGPALFKIDEDSGRGEHDVPVTQEEITKSNHGQEPPVINTESKDQGTKELVAKINEERALEKLAPMKNIFGLSNEQLRQAIRETNDQIAKDPAQLDGSDGATRLVDGIVLVAALLFFFYALNVFTRGDLGRMVLAMFPSEVASLKLSEYLMKFR